jgi:hypothetical protein
MTLREELLDLERKLWFGTVADYRRTLDDDCLVAFGQVAGVSTREQVVGTVDETDRWEDLDIEIQGMLQPTKDVAILTYHANAVRGESDRYRALVSSGYVNRGDGWKMMFHQQTPLGG